jgi:RNA polymerase sigma-70 factor (sigma-E family)
MARDDEFVGYYAAKVASVRNVAYLLCGDWHLAEDLAQTAFVKLYRAWSRITTREPLDRYVHRVLVRTYLDERRRPWRRRESPVDPYDGALDLAGSTPSTDERLHLLAALDQVPPRQRAVLVLRYWLDLPVAEAATWLGCSEGTVKSQAARGLDALRAHLTADLPTGGRP